MNHPVIIISSFRTDYGLAVARVLIESLRTFGGEFSTAPFWLYDTGTEHTLRTDLPTGVEVIPLIVPRQVSQYLFASKVYACARAEERVEGEYVSLAWLDPACLVVQPPYLLHLGVSCDAAVRPVHIRNVGLPPNDPLDVFWQGIYCAAGVQEVQSTVESFVDRQVIRSYFNSHSFAFNPAAGLMCQWFECFEKLVCDQQFQQQACADETHQVFLFQAILSTLLATRLEPSRLRILPPSYNYPYNLHTTLPVERRAAALNDLVIFTYEDRSINPAEMTDIEIREPLLSWLKAVSTPKAG